MTIIILQLWWYQIQRKSYSFKAHKQRPVWKNSFGSLVNITREASKASVNLNLRVRFKYFIWKFWVAWNVICPILSKNWRVIKNENLKIGNRRSAKNRKSEIENRKSEIGNRTKFSSQLVSHIVLPEGRNTTEHMH